MVYNDLMAAEIHKTPLIFYRTKVEKLASAIILSLFTFATILVIARGYLEWKISAITFIEFIEIDLIFLTLLAISFYLFGYRHFILKGSLEFDEEYIKVGKNMKIRYADIVGWSYNKGEYLSKSMAILIIYYLKNKKVLKLQFYINADALHSIKKVMDENGIKYYSP